MKKRTKQTMNRFRMRAIAFVIVFAMAFSAAASMPMDVFASMISFVEASVKEGYKENDAGVIEQIKSDTEPLVGEVVPYNDALYYWKISSIEDWGASISHKLVCYKNGEETTVLDTSSIPDEWDYGGFYGEGKIAIANEKIFFTVSDNCGVGECIYSCDLKGKNLKQLNGDEIKGLSLDGKYLIADSRVYADDPDVQYYVIINTETNEVKEVDKNALYTIWSYKGFVYYVKYNKSGDAIELHKVSPDKLENQKLCTIKASDSMHFTGQALYPVINGEEYVYFSVGDIVGTGNFFSNSKIVRAKLDGSDFKVIDSSQEDEPGTLFSVNKDGSVKLSDINLTYQDLLTTYYCADNKIYSIDPTNGVGKVVMTSDEYQPFTKSFPKDSYISVESVDLFGNKVYIRVENQTEQTMHSFIVNGGFLLEKDLDSGKVTLIYTYNSNNKTLESISVKTLPNKTKYYYGVDSVFDPSGLVLTATYSDGSTKDIDTNFQCNPQLLGYAGKHTITVTYERKTTSFDVSMIPIKSLGIKKKPIKLVYEKDKNFDSTGMMLLATYDDGQKIEITKNYTYDPTKLDKVGGQDILIKFAGKETKLRVAVNGIVSLNYRSDGDKAKNDDDKYEDISHAFYYSDSYFYYDNKSYHNDLAIISLGMEIASYSSHDTDSKYTKTYTADSNGYCERAKNINEYYNMLGFENVHFYNYEKSLSDNSDKAAYSFASKPIINEKGDVDTLVTVVVRGGGYGAEWASNFNVGNSGNHVGFQTPANEIYQSLVKYLASIKDTSEGEFKLWITGFSRGAAIANLTAHMINANQLVKPVNVYVYTFATPKGYYGSSNSSVDNNIFNIISSNDLIPKLACKQWGFSTYGQNVILPNYTPDVVKNCFKTLTGVDFEVGNNYTIESDIIRSLVRIAPNRNTFYSKCQENVVKQFSKNYKKNDGGTLTIPESLIVGIKNSDVDKKLMGFSFIFSDVTIFDIDFSSFNQTVENIKDKVSDNAGKLINVGLCHYPEHYLSWLETGGEYTISSASQYSGLSEEQKKQIETAIKAKFEESYQLHCVSCPVDVKVYDSSNNLVVSIVNNEVEVDELPCYVEGETKYFYTYGDDFRVELTGNGTGTMDYQVQEFNSDSEMVRTVNHYDLALTKGKQYTGQSKNTILDKTNTYALTTNSNTAKPAYDSMTPVGSKHNITIVNGASLTESAYQNECVEIIAEEKEGKYFSHWTSDAGDGIFNDAKSKATNFVMPNKDVKVTAVYDDAIPGDLNKDKIVNAKDSALLSAAFGKRKGEDGYNASADFNNDGIINAKDKAIISQNFGKRK